MKKNSHDKILKRESKEHDLSIIPKSCSSIKVECESYAWRG